MKNSNKDAIRVPPHSVDAEKSVLGGILLDNYSINICLEVINADDFFVKSNKIIFETMVELDKMGSAIDLVTLKEHLDKKKQLEAVGGILYLSSLLEVIPTSANILHYAKIVKEKSMLRKILSSSKELLEKCYSENADSTELLMEAESQISEIAQGSISKGPMGIDKIIPSSLNIIDEFYHNRGKITGIETGFVDFDDKTAGLHPSDLIVIAGRPGMGKTAFSMNIAQYAACEKDAKVLVFSLEMSAEQLAMRMLCSDARVDIHRLRTGFFDHKMKEQINRLQRSAGRLSKAKIFIDDTPGISLLELRAKARRIKSIFGVDLIIIDYLQLMRGERRYENRQQEISDISRSLKELAKELNVPVIALSQLNRAPEGRTDKRPILADLRESGAIEQDADLVAFIYREDVNAETGSDLNVAEIIIRKQRNGPVGTVKLAFLNYCTRFENLSQNEYT
ncbi:MAG: replicative DNA helicase [Candidatus Schekmanbacteria bacterium]|nr:MAG: replicative DNA helicase [Candidatus Schekmanbacteria bacterium]